MDFRSFQFKQWTAAIVNFAFLSFAAIWSTQTVYAQTTQGQHGQSGAVLLKTDRVLEGNISFTGDKYSVILSEGSSVSIPKAEVLFVGQTKREVYDFKVRNIARWSTGDHFKLTRWCMLQGMTDEAIDHYTVVAKDAGDHPRVKQLANELKQHLLRQPQFRDYLGISNVNERQVAESNPNKTDNTNLQLIPTRRVGYEGNSLWADLPPMAIHDFTNHVQPIFISRCSQAACHGASTNTNFKIIEPYGQSAPETTAANIASVRQFLNRKQNGEIPDILDFATRAHGIQRQPSISIAENDVLMNLRRWIEFVENPVVAADGASMNNNSGAVEASYQSQQSLGKLTPVESTSANQLKSVPRQASSEPNPHPQIDNSRVISPSSTPSMSDLDELDARIRLAEGLGNSDPSGESRTGRTLLPPSQVGPASTDPFAPDEFNRQTLNGQ